MIINLHGILAGFSFTPVASMETETIAFRDRVLADGGTVVDLQYVDRFIVTCKTYGIWTSLQSAADTNFAYKGTSTTAIVKVYCLKGFDYIPVSGNCVSVANASGTKSLLTSFGGAATMKTISNIGISGNAQRHIINIFNQSTSVSAGDNQNTVGFGDVGTGAGFDILLFGTSVVFHGQGSGMDTIGFAPTYSKGVVNLFELSYDDTNIKSSINGGSRISKVQDNINTSSSVAYFGGGAYASFLGMQGLGQPAFLWNTTISDSNLTSFLTFIKTEYSI